MAMKRYSIPFAQLNTHPHPAPDRSAYRRTHVFGDAFVQVWPSRAAMARSIRMQEQREYRPDDWRPLVKLGATEGYSA